MAGGMFLVVRDFALHPHVSNPRLQQRANGPGQLRDRKNLRSFAEKIVNHRITLAAVYDRRSKNAVECAVPAHGVVR